MAILVLVRVMKKCFYYRDIVQVQYPNKSINSVESHIMQYSPFATQRGSHTYLDLDVTIVTVFILDVTI